MGGFQTGDHKLVPSAFAPFSVPEGQAYLYGIHINSHTLKKLVKGCVLEDFYFRSDYPVSSAPQAWRAEKDSR